MAQFSKIIGALLSDIIRAQYEANLYAERLHAPHASIGDVELKLNYGIGDAVSECEVYETDHRRLRAFLKDFAFQTAKVIIATVVGAVKPTDVSGKNEAFRVWSLLSEEGGKEYRKLLAFLSRRVYGELVGSTAVFLDEQGSVLTGPLVTALCRVTCDDLLTLPDVDVLFPANSAGGRRELSRSLADVLSPFVSQLVSAENFATKKIVSSADVVVDTQALEKIPSECIHSIRLKISLPDELPAVEPDNNIQL